MKWWTCLAVVRILWAALPQTGYIHPDEFFQSPEVVAGDLFHLDTKRTWEFDPSKPARNVVFPYLTSGLGLLPLKIIKGAFPRLPVLTTHLLLTMPRLLMAGLTLITDLLVFELAKKFQVNTSLCLSLYASSYVTLVHNTRTFSNSVEALFFVALLYVVFVKNDMTIKTMKPVKSKVSKTVSTSHSQQRSALYVATLVVAGAFNRPTFVIYSFVPCLFWLLQNTSSVSRLLLKTFLVGFYAIYLCIFFIVADSIYFGFIKLNDIFTDIARHNWYDFVKTNFTVTPLNLILYNIKPENLKQHGIHPRITHCAVNIPMIFGPLGVLMVIRVIVEITLCLVGKRRISRECVYLIICTIVPVLLLSLFPHQEPRYLIPVSAPLVISLLCMSPNISVPWRVVWVIFNILGCAFYGVLHQGGLIPCLTNIQSHIQLVKISGESHHFVFYHTYMPPQHLLAIEKTNQPVKTGNITSQEETRHVLSELADADGRFVVHDMKGAPEDQLFSLLSNLVYVRKKTLQNINIHVISPGTLHESVSRKHTKFTLEMRQKFFPHLSMEDPPKVNFNSTFNLKNAKKIKKSLQEELCLNWYTVRVL